MTEEQWLSCTEPDRMLDFLWKEDRASERKFRLFAVACCRCIYELLTDDDLRAVEAAEQFAEGLVTAKERNAARYARHIARPARLPAASRAAGSATFASGWSAAKHVVAHSAETSLDGLVPRDLLRDVFGNPFHSLLPLPASLLEANDGLVVKLAEAAYEHRILPSGELDPARLAVLADALEEGGADAVLVEHLREQGGVHVRGCWVIDLLLGKA